MSSTEIRLDKETISSIRDLSLVNWDHMSRQDWKKVDCNKYPLVYCDKCVIYKWLAEIRGGRTREVKEADWNSMEAAEEARYSICAYLWEWAKKLEVEG